MITDTQLHYIHLESSTRCNATCMMCPHSEIKRRGTMEYNLFTSIIDQAVDFGCKTFTLFRLGEPLLFPDLFRWMDYINSKGARVSIYTNASHLTPEIGKKLQEYKDMCCDVTISFHGVEPAGYKDIMGLDFDKVYSNIQAFMEYNEIPINIYMLASYPGDAQLKARFEKLWDGTGFSGVALCHYMDWAGNIEGVRTLRTMWKEEGASVRIDPCHRVFHELDIMYDGTVCLCCLDAHGDITFGDLRNDTMEEVLNHKLRRYYQKLHNKGRSEELPLCGECSMKLRLV